MSSVRMGPVGAAWFADTTIGSISVTRDMPTRRPTSADATFARYSSSLVSLKSLRNTGGWHGLVDSLEGGIQQLSQKLFDVIGDHLVVVQKPLLGQSWFWIFNIGDNMIF